MAEKALNHTWKFDKKTREKKYKVHAQDTLYDNKPELDDDIKTSIKNMKNAGDFDFLNLVQLDSDPICPSSGCPKSEYTKMMGGKIVTYPDPDA